MDLDANDDGYGVIRIDGRTLRAHRIAYEQLAGRIPPGLQIDHLCRVRHCVNPAHLEPVTHAENVHRGEAGRWQAVKTHCKNGHEFTEANTIARDGTRRQCRECARAAMRRYRTRLAPGQTAS